MAVGGPWGPCGTSDGTKRSARPSPRPGPMVRRRNWRELTARSFPQHCSDPDLSQAPHMACGGCGGRTAPRMGQNGVPAPLPDGGRW